MRDYRNAKAMAQTLREDLSAKSIPLSHSECLELVSRALGFRNWNVLAAKIEAQRMVEATDTKPAGAKALVSTLYCSFCGKSQHDVAKLIAGPDVFICDECVSLCDDVLADGDQTFSEVTAETLRPQTTEELILFKAKVGRSLATARNIRETIGALSQNGSFAEEGSDVRSRGPQVAFFLRKSPEERRAYVSEVEARIVAMERAMHIAVDLLGQRAQG